MIDPDTQQAMAAAGAARRATASMALEEMRVLIKEKEAEVDGLKRTANMLAQRFGVPLPYAEILPPPGLVQR